MSELEQIARRRADALSLGGASEITVEELDELASCIRRYAEAQRSFLGALDDWIELGKGSLTHQLWFRVLRRRKALEALNPIGGSSNG